MSNGFIKHMTLLPLLIFGIGIIYYHAMRNKMHKKVPKQVNDFSKLLDELLPLSQLRPLIIAIDGRPGSGKTTLAVNLEKALKAQTIYLDEFFIPQAQWPTDQTPRFPFFYFRYEEFVNGIKALARAKPFIYYSYNIQTNTLSKEPTTINPAHVIIVEGVSALNAELAPLYYKQIWVASDQETEFAAIGIRENEKNLDLWKKIYLPSVDIYCKQKPWEKADIIYAGRGINQKNS